MRTETALAQRATDAPKFAGRLAGLIEAYLRQVGVGRLRAVLTSGAAIVLCRSGRLLISTQKDHQDMVARVRLAELPSVDSLAQTMDAFLVPDATPDIHATASDIFETTISRTADLAGIDAWRKISAQISASRLRQSEPTPALPGMPFTPPMRWATWWTYFSLPVSGLIHLGNAVFYWQQDAQLLSVLLVAAGLLSLGVSVYLRGATIGSWRLNWLAVVVAYLSLSLSAYVRDPTANGAGISVVLGLLAAPLWLLPNVIYWRKRKDLFTTSPSGKLPTQALWVPIQAWVLFAVIVIAAFVFPTQDTIRTNESPGFNSAPVSPVPIVDPFAEERRWAADIAAFVASRCELDPSHELVARRNAAILQRVINEIARPDMTNAQLLSEAGELVYLDPAYTPRGFCPAHQ